VDYSEVFRPLQRLEARGVWERLYKVRELDFAEPRALKNVRPWSPPSLDGGRRTEPPQPELLPDLLIRDVQGQREEGHYHLFIG